ncbi:MAG: D-aminoacyl-tRNA deacylase [Crocinitomicaceae bacterium]|jgi:D-tyrosyl-tRNA(Tyr) deacylase|nr:D-aminoacyl-tRNA deacylase [Crocinitomicaceae bacterium]
MKIVTQRVACADVKIENKLHSQISNGLLILIGIEETDEKSDADYLIQKTAGLRIFNDQHSKMNLTVNDINGEILVVSQFTLHANTKKGNRPSFIKAAKPERAIPLYNYFLAQLNGQLQTEVKSGVFGADMKVSLINDGPVTIIIDSKNKE